MPDYSKCIIYTIRTPTGLYVGSSCNFSNRKYGHKCAIHNKNVRTYNFKLYKNIRENNDEWEMKPYKLFPCKNKMEMNIEEERVRRELNANLNMCACYNSKQDIIENVKQYHENNKEQIVEYQKQYVQDNKEQIVEYKKQYYQDNKETISESQRNYRVKNKEKISEYQKQYRKEKKKRNKKI